MASSIEPKAPKWELGFTPAVWWTLRVLGGGLWLLYFLAPPTLQTDITAYSPTLGFIYYYKFWILLLILIIGAPLLQIPWRGRWVTALAYIIFFPIVAIAWIIHAIYQNIDFLLIFTPTVYSSLIYFRSNVLLFLVALLSAMFILNFNDERLIVIGMIGLFTYLVFHFGRRFSTAFAKGTVFSDLAVRVPNAVKAAPTAFFPGPPEGIDPESEKYKNELVQNLLGIYGILAAAYFGIRWVAGAIDMQRMDIYFIISIVYTFLLTAIIFALEFYGLERLEPGSFEGIKSLLSFFGLSFSILLTSADLSPVTAVSPTAIALTFAVLSCSLLIIILLVFVLMTSVRERFRRDLGELKEGLEQTTDQIAEFIGNTYSLPLRAVEEMLLKKQPTLGKFMLRGRYGDNLPELGEPPASED